MDKKVLGEELLRLQIVRFAPVVDHRITSWFPVAVIKQVAAPPNLKPYGETA